MSSLPELSNRVRGTLSVRGRAALKPPPEYMLVAFSAWSDEFEADTNPSGYVDFSLAENRLSLPLVADALNRTPAVPLSYLTYDDMIGSERMRKAVAAFFTRFIAKTQVSATEVALTAGAGATIDLLTSVLCDPGDKVLITSPAYRSFERDVGMRAGADCVSAPLSEESGFKVTAEALQKAWVAAGGAQSGIRVVLLSSPNNPTGEVLEASAIREIVFWAKSRDLHLVMDEIYALSVFSSTAEFVSVARVLGGELGDHVHIVWSFSKDFCISGCRIGVLYTKNAAVMAAITGLSYFASTSRHTQWSLVHLLEDLDWVEEYIIEHKQRLAAGYKTVTELFDLAGVPYLPSQAGFFLLLDLRKWISGDPNEAETSLWRHLVSKKVLLTPGSQMLSSNYGWFRCCFSAAKDDALRVGVNRILEVLHGM